MKFNYCSTHLEDWITDMYQEIGIKTPDDITEERIANKLGIYFLRTNRPSHHICVSGLHAIYVDSRLSLQEQREHFFHELCHVLRHYGSQFRMPLPLKEWQEYDAARFVKCATIPYQMVLSWDLDDPYIISYAAETFKVTKELSESRLIQIRSRKIHNRIINPLEVSKNENSYIYSCVY